MVGVLKTNKMANLGYTHVFMHGVWILSNTNGSGFLFKIRKPEFVSFMVKLN